MKHIIQLIGELMPVKRGTTRFVETKSIKNVMCYEVIDNVR